MHITRPYRVTHRCGSPNTLRGTPCKMPVSKPGVSCVHHFLIDTLPDRTKTLVLNAPTATPAPVINHPPHYNHGTIEAITVIEDWRLGFNLGNAVKYISRAGRKGTNQGLEDLRKAQWYLARAIEKNEYASPSR